jgi:hypothetical protein
MTPKEKAKELVEKFKNRSIELGETHSQLMAEANALIAVDEIIDSHYKLLSGVNTSIYKYWKEVKQEIELL